jgi:uncharacterized protein
MLIEFRVENHRSLRDEQVLTMDAGRVGDDADPRPRRVSGYSERLLPVAALYGANASGKSNVLAALAFMRDAVLLSQGSWAPDEGVPRDPFAWGPKRSEPSMFEVMMLIDGIRYQYGFVADDKCFLEEWLHAWPKGKKRVWFERDESLFKFGEDLRGKNKLIQEFTRPNSLFLSAAAQNQHPRLTPIYSWFRAIQPINVFVDRRSSEDSLPPSLALIRLLASMIPTPHAKRLLSDGTPQGKGLLRDEMNKSVSKLLLPFLRNADLGIVDLRVNRSESEESAQVPIIPVYVKHQSKSDDSWLPIQEESEGTKNLFRIALPILLAIQEGGTLLVDELEGSLHPSIAQQIFRQFNDPATNPRNAQLIFTTHDTNLLGTTLGEPILRRDQVWLTEKDKEGATVLYPLTDYKPRKAENLERGYLQGRYGAIPFLGNFTVAVE